ncbi:HET-domain-containing protein [Penicillium frequentans]|uniref:HET-domain-containing protein n=1 Tax=Penicillium frequentans TaxID=3151616 RepID=A0AAD6D379_9EURO|nr:HET-domain-containing protein [Penicillium glabrum]
MPWMPPALRQANESVRNTFRNMISKIEPPTAFIETKDDCDDLFRKSLGREDLCSKCRSLPVEMCDGNSLEETDGNEVHWATPLSRIIFHADWCRMCRLLLSMLVRPEFDPLKHPEVAPYLQHEIQGMSMRQWVQQGWKFTDKNWPFGRSEYRHDGATNMLGPARDVLWDIMRRPEMLQLLSQAVKIAAAGSIQPIKNTKRRDLHKSTYGDGLKEGREAATKYPLSCALQISIMTRKHPEFPGLVFASLVGFGNRPGGDPQLLSRFNLRVTHPASDQSFNTVVGLSYGKILDKNWIDTSTMRQWLGHCETYHGDRCKKHDWGIIMQRPRFLRLIDVHNLRLVEVHNPGNHRFLALSYVWGQVNAVRLKYDNKEEMMQFQGLGKFLDSLPRTIVDAMELVRAIGESYLWVDTLCILQENTSEAQEQIATMDRVYGSAVLTIVAAQGVDANGGLRGVPRKWYPSESSSLPREITQESAEIKDGTHIIAPFPCTQDLTKTIWNSRAWTFQEKLMSKRLLIFSGDEVVWHCRQMVCREDMHTGDCGYNTDSLDWLSLKPQYFGVDIDRHWVDGSLKIDRHGRTRVVRSGTFAEYAKAVEGYTLRQTTYKSDAIRAMEGLLHIFQLSFKSEFISGLPKSLLDVALLWRATRQLKRREGFPSWSWAGWEGQVTYNKPMAVERDDAGNVKFAEKKEFGEEGIQPLLRWQVYDEFHGELKRVSDHGWGIPLKGGVPLEWEATPYYAGHQSDRQIFDRPILVSDLEPRQLSSLSSSKIPHLVFLTSCVDTFQLGDYVLQNSDLEGLNPTSPPDSSELRPLRLSITDSELQWIGTVLLDSNGPEWIYRGQHEFILLSEAQYFGLDQEKYDVGEFPLYSIMLVKRDNLTGVSTRLGLGRVNKIAWMMANPVLKTVVLG